MKRSHELFAGTVTALLWLSLPLPAPASGPPNPPEAPGRVYLLRGQGWVFSGGWASLRDRLRTAGVWADDFSNRSGGRVADAVLLDHQSGRLTGPVVLVGHSRGGRQALSVAERLGRAGVPVSLVLTADVAAPPPVPAGVGRAVNLYLTGPHLYPARPLRPAPDNRGAVENVALPVAVKGLHYLNITGSAGLQEYAFRRIMEVMRQPAGNGLSAVPGSARNGTEAGAVGNGLRAVPGARRNATEGVPSSAGVSSRSR